MFTIVQLSMELIGFLQMQCQAVNNCTLYSVRCCLLKVERVPHKLTSLCRCRRCCCCCWCCCILFPQECDPAELDIEHIPEQEGEGQVIQMVSRATPFANVQSGGAAAAYRICEQSAGWPLC